MTVSNVIGAILYELQPCRWVDIVNFIAHAQLCSKQILQALKNLAVFTGKSSQGFASLASLKSVLYIAVWLLGLRLSNRLEFGSMYIILSMICVIFLNLGERKAGDVSAYSVFNKGFQQLLGTMTAEQFDNEIRHRGVENEFDDDAEIEDHNANARPVPHRPNVKKRGKKARRNYEERIRKREDLRQQLDEAFMLAEDGEGLDLHD